MSAGNSKGFVPISALTDPRQVREEMDRMRRNQRDQNEGDVIIEYPRRLLLRSPNGKYWAISVSNAGVLSASDAGTLR